MPGQEDAKAYREGDMLDSGLQLSVKEIGRQNVVITDPQGHKYYKAF